MTPAAAADLTAVIEVYLHLVIQVVIGIGIVGAVVMVARLLWCSVDVEREKQAARRLYEQELAELRERLAEYMAQQEGTAALQRPPKPPPAKLWPPREIGGR